jgi:hypothetical protein
MPLLSPSEEIQEEETHNYCISSSEQQKPIQSKRTKERKIEDVL